MAKVDFLRRPHYLLITVPIKLAICVITGDFGFNVRRTQFPDFRGRLRAVVFAEPTEVRCGPPRPSDIRAGLLPGDQLVKMNGRSVESLGREELLAIIQVQHEHPFFL